MSKKGDEFYRRELNDYSSTHSDRELRRKPPLSELVAIDLMAIDEIIPVSGLGGGMLPADVSLEDFDLGEEC